VLTIDSLVSWLVLIRFAAPGRLQFLRFGVRCNHSFFRDVPGAILDGEYPLAR